MAAHNAVVIDNGTGFTKLGYAGNFEPQFVFPTQIGLKDGPSAPSGVRRPTMDDLDFHIGYDAAENAMHYPGNYPMKHGQVQNWDHMERLWEHCFFKYLRCEPEEQLVLLTEPPMNAPENREYTAEIMFETFNVKGLHIAVQAVLALCASWNTKKAEQLGLSGSSTGTVIDSGDGVTHVIPVVDGYVIGSAIKHIPLAGRDITQFVAELLRQRETTIPAESYNVTAQKIKETFSYCCKDVASEFAAFDADPSKIKRYTGVNPRTQQPFTCDVGFEQFLGPELFFSPEMFSSHFTTPLPEVVDETIQASPIDSRRALYRNIVLSGGSTMFRHFGQRLQRDIKQIVDKRIDLSRQFAARRGVAVATEAPEVNVLSHGLQRYAVWLGGSQIASLEGFRQMVVTKAEYDEIGPSACRQSRAVFSALTV